jgi:hypothetical protein
MHKFVLRIARLGFQQPELHLHPHVLIGQFLFQQEISFPRLVK